MEMMNADSTSDLMTVYYVLEDSLNQNHFTFDFHPAFIVFHKILIVLREFEK